jgi:hypothetical protein
VYNGDPPRLIRSAARETRDLERTVHRLVQPQRDFHERRSSQLVRRDGGGYRE